MILSFNNINDLILSNNARRIHYLYSKANFNNVPTSSFTEAPKTDDYNSLFDLSSYNYKKNKFHLSTNLFYIRHYSTVYCCSNVPKQHKLNQISDDIDIE